MFKKTKIAAVTAAILGFSSMAIVPNAQAVSISEAGSTGQVLIFPYYNVNNGFTTSFNITNTTDKYKAVKMRFRESKTSNDVLDFNVYMSPEDMFTVSLTQGADGGVLLSTNDKTCTHPMFPGTAVAFRDVYDSVENADMREGYLEVIEMGDVNETAKVDVNTDGDILDAEDITIAEGLLHDSTGTPANCDVVELAWQQGVFVQGGAQSAIAANAVTPADLVILTANHTAALAAVADLVTTGDDGDDVAAAIAAAAPYAGAVAAATGTANLVAAQDDVAAVPVPVSNVTTAELALHGVDPNVPGYPDSAALGGATTSTVGYYGIAPTANSVGAIDAPTGGLAGSSVLIDINNVAGFVAEPVSIVNYSASAQHYLSSDQNFYLLPSLASGSDLIADTGSLRTAAPTAWGKVARDFGLDDTNVLPRTQVPSGVNPMPMAHALAVTSLSNQYFVEGDTSTDWVISAPMRKHGILNGYKYAPGTDVTMVTGDIAIGGETNAAGTTADNGVWTLDSDYDLKSVFNYYDREEQFDSPSVSAGDFSPPIVTNTPTADIPFNNEVNILALSAAGSNNDSVLGSANKQGVSLATGFVNGWGTFAFSYDLEALYDTTAWTAAAVAVGGTAEGAPLTGFMAGKGTLGGENVGEVFPHIMKR